MGGDDEEVERAKWNKEQQGPTHIPREMDETTREKHGAILNAIAPDRKQIAEYLCRLQLLRITTARLMAHHVSQRLFVDGVM